MVAVILVSMFSLRKLLVFFLSLYVGLRVYCIWYPLDFPHWDFLTSRWVVQPESVKGTTRSGH